MAEVAFMSKFAYAFPLRASQQNVLQGSIRHAMDEVTPIIIEYATRKAIHDASHEIAELWISRTLGNSVK